MSAIAKVVMQKFYRQAAGQPERLPSHRDEPDALLRRAVEARAARGRAIDVGCGAGVFTIWLAQAGMETVGIDLFPEAIQFSRTRCAIFDAARRCISGSLLLPRLLDLDFYLAPEGVSASKGTVDRLRAVARQLLLDSPDFKQLVKDLGG